MRPILATISRRALRHNLDVAKRYADGANVWAVVKADAYGHGLMRAVTALGDADGFALLEVQSALQLRESGVRAPVLLIEGYFGIEELRVFSERGLTAVVHDEAQVRMLETERLAVPIDVYLKINTGMNRLGFAPLRAARMVERLRACAAVRDITLMTHFADADGPSGVAEQMQTLERAGIRDLPRSLANSAALIRYPETRADWVRPGIMLYGCSPFPDVSADVIGLIPAMTLKSRLIAVQELRAGDRVGYGGTFTAKDSMRVGIVACGYADGYPRHAPGFDDRGTPIVVAGRRTRTVGRVSMDLLFAELTSIPEASVGSEVTLWGEGLSADEVAAASGTLSYELLCALAARVPVKEIE
ncbi:MAG: alanine racemase [Betaproteobacteria bacterium RIFCSPLOWO2_02_FULL_63_19]|nr:MAG: alanine racemase [Betaproteobacteria bacterium RIFCSPLOWO2_02_FULL_63_19]